MRTENPGISAEFLSLSLLSQKSEFPWIVPECVSMSICEDFISNLAILVNPPNLGGLAYPILPD
jgi:hypothetical protein